MLMAAPFGIADSDALILKREFFTERCRTSLGWTAAAVGCPYAGRPQPEETTI